MFAFIYVFDHPNFVASKKDGTFEIRTVPPGCCRVMYSYRARPVRLLKTLEMKAGARETLHFQVDGSQFQIQPHLNKFGSAYKAVTDKKETGELVF